MFVGQNNCLFYAECILHETIKNIAEFMAYVFVCIYI